MPLKITPELRRKVAAAYDNCYAHPSDEKVSWQDYKCSGAEVTLNGYGYWVLSRDEVIRMEMNPDADGCEDFEFDGIVWIICPL